MESDCETRARNSDRETEREKDARKQELKCVSMEHEKDNVVFPANNSCFFPFVFFHLFVLPRVY